MQAGLAFPQVLAGPVSELTYSFIVIPQILADCRTVTDGWGLAGIHDPFEKIYEVSWLMTS